MLSASHVILAIVILLNVGPVPGANGEVTFEILSQNNTGPQNRSRPVLLCYPDACYVASGGTFPSAAFPTIFFNDVWEMTFNIETESVEWTQLPFVNPPPEAQGLFHQFWRNNLTSFSWTAGLNDFNPNTFQATCQGARIVTYDFVNQAWEVKTPTGTPLAWDGITGGACDRYQDAVICFGGFSCTTFQDVKLLTKYNITTNEITVLIPAGFANLTARHHSSVNCDADGTPDKHLCVIGSGDRFGGGTIDQWNIYKIQSNTLEFFEPPNKPQNIQYIHPDHQQVWKLKDGDYKVVRDKNKLLLSGGDNATGASGTSNTVRVVKVFRRNSLSFKEIDTDDLFTIKQQYLKNIPRFRENEEDNAEEDDECDLFIEYGGFEENANVALHYPNVPVLFKKCSE